MWSASVREIEPDDGPWVNTYGARVRLLACRNRHIDLLVEGAVASMGARRGQAAGPFLQERVAANSVRPNWGPGNARDRDWAVGE